MKRIAGLIAALLLLAAPVALAQSTVPVGTVAVGVYVWDGQQLVPVGDPIIVPPLSPACVPDEAA